MMTDYVAIPGPLGAMLVAADERALLGVWFEGQKYHPDPAGWTHRPDNPLLARAAEQLRGYFEDQGRAGFDLQTALRRRSRTSAPHERCSANLRGDWRALYNSESLHNSHLNEDS